MNSNSKSRSELSSVRDWMDYNTYVRKKYLVLFEKLPVDILTKDNGASYPSILDIHVHILDVIKSWFNYYETGNDLAEVKGLSLEETKNLQKEVDDYVSQFMKNLTEEKLYKTFSLNVTKKGKETKVQRKLSDLLWHLVEEELQHRGEINALLWQENVEPPITSWGKWKMETGWQES